MTRSAYKRIQRIAIALVHKHRLPPAGSGPCITCGGVWRKYRVWDHRNYSDALTVRPVCFSCNAMLAPAAIDFWNIDTLEMLRVRFKPRVTA